MNQSEIITLRNGKVITKDQIKHVGVSLITNDSRKSGETIPIISDLRSRKMLYVNKSLEVCSVSNKLTVKVITKGVKKSLKDKWVEVEFDKLLKLKDGGNNEE